MQYRVVWEIDLDAESIEDAARQELEIQRDPASIATCFIVTDENSTHPEIDLCDKAGTADFMMPSMPRATVVHHR
jgi:hypothetical protein